MALDTLHHQKCPSRDELRRLADGRLSDDRQAELTDHVDACAGCQDRLESEACGGAGLSACVRGLDRADPPRESAYWRAMDRAEAAVTGEYGSGDPSLPELKLDFLQPSDTPGRLGRIGTFEIVRVVGRGGMGVVLHAFDPCLERDVAIKVLDPQLANNEVARERFCREARLAASVSHDNLVAVHQVDEMDGAGLPYLVMQLINGETLEQRLRRVGKLTVAEAARVGRDAAAGLAAAHAAGLIHRDIKPGNILLEAGTDKVKLTDFGLARAVEDTKLTRTGFVAGTPLYMAPEQARGDEVDGRADLFSLGTVLYEAVTGVPPFDGKTPLAVLRRVADEPHAPIRRLVSDVPDWFEDLIDQMLAKDPADRIQTAAEAARVLKAHSICVPQEVVEPDCSLGRTASRIIGRRRSRRAVAAFVAIPFLLGGAVGSVATWGFLPRGPEPRAEAAAGVPHPPAAVPGAPAGPDELAKFDPNTGAVWSVSAAADGKTVALGLEDGTVILWDSVARKKLEDIQAHQGPVLAAELTPDGKRLVTASDDGTVKVWELQPQAKSKQLHSLAHPNSVRSLALSTAGDQFVTGDRAGKVRVWNVGDEEPSMQFDHEGVINAVAFHKDGLTVASASTDKTVALWEVPSGKRRGILRGHTGPVYSLSFSPDGGLLATASWDRTIRLWDTNEAKPAGDPIAAHDESILAIDFACCGRVLATAGQDGLVKVWDVTSHAEMARFTRHKGTVHAVRFTPDGKALLTGGQDGTLRAWKIRD